MQAGAVIYFASFDSLSEGKLVACAKQQKQRSVFWHSKLVIPVCVKLPEILRKTIYEDDLGISQKC